MSNPWFRLYGSEYLSDPKMDHLDGNERSIWITLLCFASQNNGVAKAISEEFLIKRAGVRGNYKRYLGVLEKFKGLGMVDISNTDVTICNWAKRQFSESYQRVLDYRQKSNDLKRKSNANVTPYTDTESDTERDNSVRSDTTQWNTQFFKTLKDSGIDFHITPEERLKYPRLFRRKYAIEVIAAAIPWARNLTDKKGNYYWLDRMSLPNLYYKIIPQFLENQKSRDGTKKLNEMKSGVGFIKSMPNP